MPYVQIMDDKGDIHPAYVLGVKVSFILNGVDVPLDSIVDGVIYSVSIGDYLYVCED
jgi:hypothetical protein